MNYVLRQPPDALWEALKARGREEGLSLRVALLKAITLYVVSRYNSATDQMEARSLDLKQ